jgi:N12 class adenine-specific DNA methylase
MEVAAWGVRANSFAGSAAGTSEWGTGRRHAGQLLHDALNSATPQIYDVEIVDGGERRVFNAEATEAAKEKLVKIKTAFANWIWTDPDRADQLSRLYNDRFNNLVPRHFDGRHLVLPGASDIIRLYEHQKRSSGASSRRGRPTSPTPSEAARRSRSRRPSWSNDDSGWCARRS